MSRVRRRCEGFRGGRLIELSETDDSACAGESVGNDRLTLLAHLEGDDEGWSAQLHAAPRLARVGSKRRQYVQLGVRRGNQSGAMATGKPHSRRQKK